MTDDVDSLISMFADDADRRRRERDTPPIPLCRSLARSGQPSARPTEATRTAKTVSAPRALPLPARAFAPKEWLSASRVALACALRSALRPVIDLWLGHPVLIVVDLPDALAADAVTRAIETLCAPLDKHAKGLPGTRNTDVVEVATGGGGKTGAARKTFLDRVKDELSAHVAASRRLFFVVEHGANLPEEIVAFNSARVILPPADRRHLIAACRRVVGIEPGSDLVDGLLTVSRDELDLVLRPGMTARQIGSILAHHASRDEAKAQEKNRRDERSLTLDTLPGMGAATQWGQELARDLKDWRDGIIPWNHVDRGVLLFGRPGTGKTTYARALAASCAVPLIATSVTEWQSTGHLGDLLGAMRQSFKSARDQAPSILFLDELDSIGDRTRFSGDSRNYSIQVVNGLLECLDGIGGREGVVVVAACNRPDDIDPAVLRSGRLDRMIEIPLPDATTRAAILRFHLGSEISAASEDQLIGIAQRIPGWTGADIERLVRDARRVARRARRPLRIDDLAALLPPPFVPTPEIRRRFAVHEAGHAIAVVLLDVGELLSVRIGHDAEHAASGGATSTRPKTSVVRTTEEFDAELVMLFAGTVAEAVIIGSRSTGASGDAGSDLDRATLLAARVELHHGLGAAPIVISGDGERQLHKLIERDAVIRGRIEARLREAYARAEDLIGEHRDVVDALATRLMDKGELSGAEVREIIERHDRTTAGGCLHVLAK